jgi:hypothetical protein
MKLVAGTQAEKQPLANGRQGGTRDSVLGISKPACKLCSEVLFKHNIAHNHLDGYAKGRNWEAPENIGPLKQYSFPAFPVNVEAESFYSHGIVANV